MDTDSILPFNGGCEDCPMENVSVKNAQEFIGRLNAMTGKTSVSYTHLDVYKRQPTVTCRPFERKLFLTVRGKILPCEKIGQEHAIGSVSYTHLDVYKRQLCYIQN